MRSLKLLVLLVALGIPAGLQAAKVRYGSEGSIYAVNPGYLVAKKLNTIVITGKNISGTRSCALIPVVGDSDGSGIPVLCESAVTIPGTEQLLTRVDLSSHPDEANYILLLLTTAPNCPSNSNNTGENPPAGKTKPNAPAPTGNQAPTGEKTGTPTGEKTGTATGGKADNPTPENACDALQSIQFLKVLNENPTEVLAYTVIHARGATATPPNPAQLNSGNQLGQASPFAGCLNGNVDPNSQINQPGIAGPAVNCASSLLTDGEVKDNFGGHVNHTYFALQVRISNQNANNDFLLRDILLTLPDGRVVSSRVRRFAQGVALKGKSLDIRAGFYNSLQAAGSLYGALSVFASPGFQAAGNALQGSFLAGFAQIFPDYTTENVNRFNNAVFDDQSPSIVPKDSIGQPPLYVVALVPKPPELKGEALRFYERSVAVSIEGTFIKQVSLVALSTPVLDFGSEYISPDYAAPFLTDSTDGTKGLQLLRDAAKANELPETIMNNNSTPMNITGLKLVSTTPSSTLSKSPDFDFDLKRTDCGRVADKSDKDFDPQAPFSVAAQGSCTLWVYFHPNGLTAASATVQLLGNNLDGPTTFTLKGNAIGILVDSKEITPNKPPVACSHADKTACSIKLGNVSDSTATIPIFVISNDSAVVTPEQDGTQVKSSDQTALTCSPHTETDFAKGAAAACKIPLALDPAKGSTTLTLSNATSTLATYAVTYQTKAVDVKPDALSPTPQGSDVKVTGIVNEAGNSAVHVTDGTVTATVDGKSAGPPVSVGTDGRFSVDFGAVLPIGNHQIALSYESGKNSVYQSKIITVPVTITAPPDPPQPAFPAAGVTAGTSVSVILTLKTNGGVACNGKVTVAEQGATTPVSGDVTNGSATLTMAVKKGKQKETVTFTPTDTSCAQLPAADVSLIGH